MPPPTVVSLQRVSRLFRGVPAVNQVSLDIAGGEFFSLLGPSGCGKTTTLRLIAGFDDPEPDGGTIRIQGKVVNGTRPYQRPVGFVFQNYALFPHLSVAQNISFGLEEHRVPAAKRRERVERALELVRLDSTTFADRRPSELSGGQRQRVALARALVLEPPILLLDEPLAALDLQLRKEMRLELRQLNRALGITFVLVTHDQEEALVMSDRIAVMSAGRVVQVGSPAEVYERPRTPFVAGFIGDANLLSGTVVAVDDGSVTVAGPDGATWRVPMARATLGDVLQIVIRPERHELAAENEVVAGLNTLAGQIREIVFVGESLHIIVEVSGGTDLRVAARNHGTRDAPLTWSAGQRVQVTWRPGDAQVLTA